MGGTSLSLQLGYRISVEIDLFTDTKYGSIDFAAIEADLKDRFSYAESLHIEPIGVGKGFYIGGSPQDIIKVDFYYTDSFIRDALEVGGIRFASLEDIAAMKLDVISTGGRKKDFWDIHELMTLFSLDEMIGFNNGCNPYTFEREKLILQLIEFEKANEDFDPNCLQKKTWDQIRTDILYAVLSLERTVFMFYAMRKLFLFSNTTFLLFMPENGASIRPRYGRFRCCRNKIRCWCY